MSRRVCLWIVAVGRPTGFDRVRNVEIADKHVQLKYLEEAFTSEHWMVRIYRSALLSFVSLTVVVYWLLLISCVCRLKKPETHPNFEDKIAREKQNAS